MTRADRHNNPLAFTTDIALLAGLLLNKDYTVGDPFKSGTKIYYTARLVGNPIAICVRVIDKIGFLTKTGIRRWEYMDLKKADWLAMTVQAKIDLIGHMYMQHEGGTEMRKLFNGV